MKKNSTTCHKLMQGSRASSIICTCTGNDSWIITTQNCQIDICVCFNRVRKGSDIKGISSPSPVHISHSIPKSYVQMIT